MIIRKATSLDIDAVAGIYSNIHTAEEKGDTYIGWKRGIYPERATAESALAREDLFVLESSGKISGTAILNKIQVDVYEGAPWKYSAGDDEVMVMHTLVIDPGEKCKGLGKAFEQYYEEYALKNNCHYLRIDTNAKNTTARAFYKKLGYEEVSIVPCIFNGLKDVNLVLLEKYIP